MRASKGERRPSSRAGRRWAMAGASLALLGLTSGCTSSNKGAHHAATPKASASALASVQNRLLGQPAASAAAPLASAAAAIHLIGIDTDTTRLTADVVRVDVSGSTTVLTWRLRSADGTSLPASGNWASGGTSSATDTRAVALIDTAGQLRLLPYVNAGQAVFGESDCTCSDTPRSVGSQGADLYATYPALSAGATTVTVVIPGFAPMPDVPVTRG